MSVVETAPQKGLTSVTFVRRRTKYLLLTTISLLLHTSGSSFRRYTPDATTAQLVRDLDRVSLADQGPLTWGD